MNKTKNNKKQDNFKTNIKNMNYEEFLKWYHELIHSQECIEFNKKMASNLLKSYEFITEHKQTSIYSFSKKQYNIYDLESLEFTSKETQKEAEDRRNRKQYYQDIAEGKKLDEIWCHQFICLEKGYFYEYTELLRKFKEEQKETK